MKKLIGLGVLSVSAFLALSCGTIDKNKAYNTNNVRLAATSNGLNITAASGSQETAWVEWNAVSGAQSYNVYYKAVGGSYVKIDDMLIRKYPTGYRADMVGLKAGSYEIKVAAVKNGSEAENATTNPVNVIAHDRTGFAFSSQSPLKEKQ